MSVVLRGVTAHYANGFGVDDVSFVAESRRYVALLGGSGSGKTTLLRAIAGLLPMASGRIELDGADVSQLATEKRHVGFVFQGFALFPNLDVAGNVAYGLKARGVAVDERAARVAEALALAGLPGSERRHVDTLSGGEQQRVAIARALAPRPKVLLLDEPLANLDAALRVATRERLRTLHEHAQITTLHVTHDREEALAVADDMAILFNGRLKQFGPTEVVWNEPCDAPTAEFLGMTLWDGVAAQRRIELPAMQSIATESPIVGSCQVAFRPIDLALVHEGGPWSVSRRLHLGDTVEVLLVSTYGSLRMRCAPHSPEAALRVGMSISIGLRSRPLAVFQKSGTR